MSPKPLFLGLTRLSDLCSEFQSPAWRERGWEGLAAGLLTRSVWTQMAERPLPVWADKGIVLCLGCEGTGRRSVLSAPGGAALTGSSVPLLLPGRVAFNQHVPTLLPSLQKTTLNSCRAGEALAEQPVPVPVGPVLLLQWNLWLHRHLQLFWCRECAKCFRVNQELDGHGTAFGEGGNSQEKFVRNGHNLVSEVRNQHLFHSQTCKKNQIPFKLLVKNESAQLTAFYLYCANRRGPLSRFKFLSNGRKMHWQVVSIVALGSSAEI